MAWIYQNESLWIISLSSDGISWITIADKNLGATQVWTQWQTTTQSNTWYYYQRWNNYGFPWIDKAAPSTSSTQVDVSSYWPWNYYSNNIYRSRNDWATTSNANLWGWTTWTVEAMRWPCDSWYHIPSKLDWDNLLTMLTSLSWKTLDWIQWYLHIAMAWYRSTNGDIWAFPESNWYLWSASSFNDTYASIFIYNSLNIKTYTEGKWYGLQIRPFKNEPVIPYANEWWTKKYWDDLPDRPEPPLPKLKWLINWNNYYYFDTAPIHASSLTLNKNSITFTTSWQAEQLTATVAPDDAVEKKIFRISSDENVARVDDEWLVTCVTPGECTITASTSNWITDTCHVNVIHATSVTLDKHSIAFTLIWQTEQLTATVLPADAIDKSVVWSSSNDAVATVDQNWLVTGIWAGNCTITVTTVDWWLVDECTLTLTLYTQITNAAMILVGWGWWWWSWCCRCPRWAWWGWWWAVVICTNYTLPLWNYAVKIWSWWCWGAATTSDVWWWGWTCTCFRGIVANWWCWWGLWWWNSWNWKSWWTSLWYSRYLAGWWWGWASENWCKPSCWTTWWNWWGWCWPTVCWIYFSPMWWWWGGWWCANYWSWWSWWGWHWASSSANASYATWIWWWGWWWYETRSWCWWQTWAFIFIYPKDCWYQITWWNCCREANWYCIHCFISSGTSTLTAC